MTARLGPRLSAHLLDAGPEAADSPALRAAPVPYEEGVEVLLEVSGVDLAALEAAGLHLISGTEPVLIGLVLPSNVAAVAAVPGVAGIHLPAIARPQLHDSVPATHADRVSAHRGLDGTGVIVGVVDSGIDIYHQSFRKPDGSTRLLSLYDTTAPYNVTAFGAPAGGSFILSWQPPARWFGTPEVQRTAALPFNTQADQVRAALAGFAGLDAGDVTVTGGPLPGTPITVTIQGQYLHQDIQPITVASGVTPPTAMIAVVPGRTYSQDEINEALHHPETPFFSWDTHGHGTHVTGIAGGSGAPAGHCRPSGYYKGVAPGAELIAVKVGASEAAIMRGATYVFDQATAAGKPAVVNISLGVELGPHDGSRPIDQTLDKLLDDHPARRAIVVSAGNDGHLFNVDAPNRESYEGGGSHSHAAVDAGKTVERSLVIQPGDKTSDVIDIWYGGNARLSFLLTDPEGAKLASPAIPAFQAYNTYATKIGRNGVFIASGASVSSTGRHNIALRIDPPPGGAITNGTWTLSLTETAGAATEVDCWVVLQKTDPHPRFINAHQDQSRTLTTPATAHNVITVANYDWRDRTLHVTSSRGPTVDERPPGMTKPDIAAPGVGITSTRSHEAPGACPCACCGDFYTTLDGTSMSAPHVTGIVALMFQANADLTYPQIRAALRKNADPPDPNNGLHQPDFRWGAGIVNAEKVMDDLLQPHAPAAAEPAAGSVVPAVVPGLVAAFSSGAGASRTRELRRAVLATPAGQILAALISIHADEVIRLVNHERRVLVAWHRMHGPDLLPELLRQIDDTPRLPPGAAPGLERFLTELERAGSPRLRADIARHRDLLLALPGLGVADLARLPLAG